MIHEMPAIEMRYEPVYSIVTIADECTYIARNNALQSAVQYANQTSMSVFIVALKASRWLALLNKSCKKVSEKTLLS